MRTVPVGVLKNPLPPVDSVILMGFDPPTGSSLAPEGLEAPCRKIIVTSGHVTKI